jgi:hypothetical protein
MSTYEQNQDKNNIWNISLNNNYGESILLGKNIWFSGNDVYMYHNNDITIVGYGRIYNEIDLWNLIRKEPEPKIAHSLQIVVELYQKIGFEKTLEYLDGDFSFVLFDMNIYGEESLLYIVRDYLGLIPLYQWIANINKKVQFLDDIYNDHTTQNQFVFSSSISKQDGIINETVVNGTYMVFTHSFKVSANWKYKNTIHYYKLPFHSTSTCAIDFENKKIEIEKALIRKIRYIGGDKNKNEIGIIANTKKIDEFTYLDKNAIDYKLIPFIDKNENTMELEEKYPTIIQQLKQKLNNNDPSIIRAYFIPILIAKYIKENEPQMKYVFMIEPFVYKWMYINPFDRREELNSVIFRERLNGWIDAFFEYGIDLIIPYLDRTLLQKI